MPLSDAIDWAGRFIEIDEATIWSTLPWGTTVALRSSGSHDHYLKVAPLVLPVEARLYRRLSATFPERVPACLATSCELNAVLLSHHGGEPIASLGTTQEIRAVLGPYAALQTAAWNNRDLIDLIPTIDLGALEDRLRQFVGLDGKTGAVAARWVEPELLGRIAELLNGSATKLNDLLGSLADLPATLNHCDLHAGNLARRDDGTLVFFDWSDATAGPPGLSLADLIPSINVPVDRMTAESRSLLDLYLSKLGRGGYPVSRLSVGGLRAASIVGVIHNTVRFEPFVDAEGQHRDLISSIVTKSLVFVANSLIEGAGVT